jgi:hypothetical protein
MTGLEGGTRPIAGVDFAVTYSQSPSSLLLCLACPEVEVCELAAIIGTWLHLPEFVRTTISALVKSVGQD